MLAETMHTSALCLLFVAANSRRRALLEDALVPMLREGDAPSRRERRVAPSPIDFEDWRRASSWPNLAASTGERDIVIHFSAWHLSPLPRSTQARSLSQKGRTSTLDAFIDKMEAHVSHVATLRASCPDACSAGAPLLS